MASTNTCMNANLRRNARRATHRICLYFTASFLGGITARAFFWLSVDRFRIPVLGIAAETMSGKSRYFCLPWQMKLQNITRRILGDYLCSKATADSEQYACQMNRTHYKQNLKQKPKKTGRNHDFKKHYNVLAWHDTLETSNWRVLRRRVSEKALEPSAISYVYVRKIWGSGDGIVSWYPHSLFLHQIRKYSFWKDYTCSPDGEPLTRA